MHIATTVKGDQHTLQGPYSDVKIDIASGAYGTLTGYVELDPQPYLEHIPDDECLITPIPNFRFFQMEESFPEPVFRIALKQTLDEGDLEYIQVQPGDIYDVGEFDFMEMSFPEPVFRIRLKHTLDKEDLKYIQVRHGDIYDGTEFELIPHKDNNPDEFEIFWEADINFITITTPDFSQFLCTICKKVCDTRLVAYVTGAIKEIGPCTIAESVVFMCPHQFTTKDYEAVCYMYVFFFQNKVILTVN